MIGLGSIGGNVQAVDFTEITIDSSQPNQPWMKEIADIDLDGKPDLIVSGRSGPLVWYKNPGWTKTTISTMTGLGSTSTGIESGDIDNDGDIDIALANGFWYMNPLNDGVDPSVGGWTVGRIGNIIKAHDIYFGDLDSDGDLDVVKRDQGSFGNIIRVYRQDAPLMDGSLAWTEREIASLGGEGLILGDIDHDADLDIIIGSYWYENTGDIVNGDWAQRQFTTTYGHSFVVVKTGDINGDAYPDVVMVPAEFAGGTEKISWFEGVTDPKIATMPEHILDASQESIVHSLQIANINNDGAEDIIIAEMHQGSDPDEVASFINNGEDTGWSREIYSPDGSHNVQAADLDGDGDIDFFGANHGGNSAALKWWRNESNPSFSLDSWQRHVVDDSKPWRSIFIIPADVNGDALPDIVTGGWWYENPGSADGTWTRNVIGSPLNNVATVADFDQDGDLDILGTEGQGSTSNDDFVWARNNGSGVFTILDNIESGDGDFLQGVSVSNLQPGEMHVALSWHLANKGVNTLTVPENPSVDTWIHAQISSTSQDEDLSHADIDRDGDMDLLLGTRWLENTGSGWTLTTVNGTGGKPDRNELVDMNRDGRVDSVVGFEAINVPGKLAWYEQPADLSDPWTEHVIATPVGPMSMDVVDMDHDGDPDVIVGEHNLSNPAAASLIVYENTGNAATWTPHVVYTGDEHHDGARVVDIDRDGDMDIVSIGWGHSRVVVYENLAVTGGIFTDTTPPEIDSVVAIGDAQVVRVIFNEKVTAASAEATANYSISGGISVLEASLQADGESVVLTTDALQPSTPYTLTVQNISDGSGNISGEIETNFLFIEINLGLGLVAYWPFEEGTGTFTADVTPGDNDGQLASGASWTPGIVGNAVALDGADDYIDLPNMDIPGEALSISAWFRSDALDNCGSRDCRIVSKADGTAEGDHYWMLSSFGVGSATRLRFRLKTGGTTTTLVADSGDLGEGEWIHAVAVYDGSEMRLYKDGELVGTTTKTGMLSTNADIAVNIGRNPNGYGAWDGAVDEVRLYDRALTPEEIITLASHVEVNPDSDSDGIDDSWENTWFNNLSSANATSDFDGDGYTDLQEYLNALNGENDPNGAAYNPTTSNEPGGTGYTPPVEEEDDEDDFLLRLLPAILGHMKN